MSGGKAVLILVMAAVIMAGSTLELTTLKLIRLWVKVRGFWGFGVFFIVIRSSSYSTALAPPVPVPVLVARNLAPTVLASLALDPVLWVLEPCLCVAKGIRLLAPLDLPMDRPLDLADRPMDLADLVGATIVLNILLESTVVIKC